MTPTRAFLLIVPLLLLASCAPQHPKDMQQIEVLRAEAEDLIKAQNLMGYTSWVLGTPSNQDSLYRAHQALFTEEHINLVQRAEQDEPDAIQRKRLRYFRRHLTLEFISKAIAPLTDRLSTMEASATVSLNGKRVLYRQIALLLANETDQHRRAAIYMSADSLIGAFNVTCREIEDSTRNLAVRLGYPSYNQMIGQLEGFSPEHVGEMAAHVLGRTDSLYNTVLQQMLKEYLSSDVKHFFRYDTPVLFRSKEFDTYFPAAAMLHTIASTYAGLGITIDEQKNLHINAEMIPTKNPRAVCFPVEIPNDVRLSIKPLGGLTDYDALYHEMGHGQHFAHTREQSLEFKYLGESTVTEAFAFLSEYLLANQAWLRERTTMSTSVLKKYIRARAFHRLFYVRRYCAKVLYELQLHAGARDPERLYSTLLSGAVGYQELPSDRLRYLTDLDANFYSASYVRAWFLEAQLNEYLTKRFGANWFENPRAGDFLKSIWATGDRLTGEEVAKLIGYDAITPDAWMSEINGMMLLSTQ